MVTGRMILNGDPKIPYKWMVIHVLKTNIGMRLADEWNAHHEAEVHMSLKRSCEALLDDDEDHGQGAMGKVARDDGNTDDAIGPGGSGGDRRVNLKVNLDEGQIVNRCHQDGAPIGRPGERGWFDEKTYRSEVQEAKRAETIRKGATPKQVAAGLFLGRTFDGEHEGKVSFEGIVTHAEGDWAILSEAVFLHRSYIASKWGHVNLGDHVIGFLVPEERGGCKWRCIHVKMVDRGGQEKARLEREAFEREEELRIHGTAEHIRPVNPKLIPVIVGRAGANVKKMQDDSGASVVIDRTKNCVVVQGTKRQVEKAVAMLDMFGDGSKMIEEGMLFQGQSKRGTVISIRELAGKGYIKPDAEYGLDHDYWFEFKTDLNPDVRPEQVSVGTAVEFCELKDNFGNFRTVYVRMPGEPIKGRGFPGLFAQAEKERRTLGYWGDQRTDVPKAYK